MEKGDFSVRKKLNSSFYYPFNNVLHGIHITHSLKGKIFQCIIVFVQEDSWADTVGKFPGTVSDKLVFIKRI